jgi:hypothetical protein
MYRWAACPGSVRLSEGIEKTTSSYAEAGTRAHEIAADWLEAARAKHPDVVAADDEEMAAACQVYVDTIMEDWQGGNQGDQLLIEQKFDLSHLHPGMFGTGDAVMYLSSERFLRVYDFKYGQGIPVEVMEEGKPNLQLLYYGLGAMETFPFPVEEVELVIIQPRCMHPDGPVRRVRLPALDMIEFSADLIDAAKRTEDPNAPLVPGDHCHFCPARAICPALRAKANELAALEFAPALSYDPAKLSEALAMVEVMKAWCAGVHEFAYREAEHGRVPPGWKLVQKRAHRKWKSVDAAEKVIMTKTNLHRGEAFHPPELKSPAQIEKLLTKEYRAILKDITVQESSGRTLVHESDPRPGILLDAANAFKDEDLKELM